MISDQLKLTILDNVPVIIALHDKENRLLWANKEYCKYTGLSLNDLIGKKCFTAWGLGNICNSCPVVLSIKTGEAQEAELSPENQCNWPPTQGAWLVKSFPIKDEKGELLGVIEASFDITSRKNTELERDKYLNDLKKMNSFMRDREIRIIELKEEIRKLKNQ